MIQDIIKNRQHKKSKHIKKYVRFFVLFLLFKEKRMKKEIQPIIESFNVDEEFMYQKKPVSQKMFRAI